MNVAPPNGYCVGCRNFAYDNADSRLCTMCHTSPSYKARRASMAAIPEKAESDFVTADGGGLRYDEGKERVDLMPADALLVIGGVYGAGAKKYPARNWERGMPWSKVIGPLLRHLFKWMMGETFDPEDGQRHIAKVAWNAMALLTYELRGIGVDDRGVVKPRLDATAGA